MFSQRLPLLLLLGGLIAAGFGLQAAAGDREPIWIDVRSYEEYAERHLEGTEHIPHTEIAEHINDLNPDKDQPLHIFCRSGARAHVAILSLRELGYTNLHNEGSLEEAAEARPDLEKRCVAEC